MKKKYKYKNIIFLCLFLWAVASPITGQTNIREHRKVNNTFHKIERSISSNSANGISKYFNSRVFVNLPNNKNNYFSSNQLFYLLKNYFSTHNVMYFSFDKVSVGGRNPFGYGSVIYEHLGLRKTSTIYVSLGKVGTDWRITKFVVN